MATISIAAFTVRGNLLADRLEDDLGQEHRICRYTQDLRSWCREQFEARADCIIFVGAAGIAVRQIAPYIKSKQTDPAVLVIDEAGQFVISLLSGHLGGANAFARLVALRIGATPVITTATDVNGLFAADVFAKQNSLQIENLPAVRRVSAALLAGEQVGIYCEKPVEGSLPQGLVKIPGKTWKEAVRNRAGCPLICIADAEATSDEAEVLFLRPRRYVLGIGCRKGKTTEELLPLVMQALEAAGTTPEGVYGIASIDLKQDEAGILALARRFRVPFVTFPADVLRGVEGTVSSSAFVEGVTGVDNVCERAALALCEGTGTLAVPKLAADGVTCAVAVRDWRVSFEQ